MLSVGLAKHFRTIVSCNLCLIWSYFDLHTLFKNVCATLLSCLRHGMVRYRALSYRTNTDCFDLTRLPWLCYFCFSLTLAFEVMAHVSNTGGRNPSGYQVWTSSIFPFRRYGRFSVTSLISIVTLTFWPLNGVTESKGHQSYQLWASQALPFSS